MGVTGIPDPKNPDIGELSTAFVVLQPDHQPSSKLSQELTDLVAAHLTSYTVEIRKQAHSMKRLGFSA